MNHLFSLNAEGGPLLCLDARAAAVWKGAENGARDYAELCAKIDAQPYFSAAVIPIVGTSGVVWEMEGAGTADVFIQSDGRVEIVRAWLTEDTAEELAKLTERKPVSRVELGVIDIPSGVVAVLWAAESGRGMPQQMDAAFKRIVGTAINESAFAVNVANRRFSCWDERVEIGESQARRLTLVPY